MKEIIVAQNIKRLKENDIILLSYPRSGNTWVRFILSDVICQHSGFETSTKLPINMGSIIPSLNKGNIDEMDERLLKSSSLYPQ